MVLDCSAMLTLFSQLKDADLTDRVRVALGQFYQEQIFAEAAEMVDALPHEPATYRKGLMRV